MHKQACAATFPFQRNLCAPKFFVKHACFVTLQLLLRAVSALHRLRIDEAIRKEPSWTRKTIHNIPIPSQNSVPEDITMATTTTTPKSMKRVRFQNDVSVCLIEQALPKQSLEDPEATKFYGQEDYARFRKESRAEKAREARQQRQNRAIAARNARAARRRQTWGLEPC